MANKAKKSKRFNYNLATALKVRGIKEKQQQEKFNAATKKLESERQKEKDLNIKLQNSYAALKEFMSSGDISNVIMITIRKHHIKQIGEEITEQKKVVIEAEKKVEVERKALSKCVMDRRILEKDREHKRTAWKKVMDKEANKFLDDISSIQFSKKSRE